MQIEEAVKKMRDDSETLNRCARALSEAACELEARKDRSFAELAENALFRYVRVVIPIAGRYTSG